MKKKTTIDKLAHKYALNIKQIRGPGPTKIIDFKNLNKNFYDDIESNTITIRDDTKLLNKIKDNSIKEFIYTNKGIPDIWKNKLNYQDELLNVITNDKKLLSYIGSSTLTTKKNYSLDNKFPKINVRYNGSKLSKSRNIINISNKKESNSMNEISEKNNNINVFNTTLNRGLKNKFNLRNKGELTDKEINTLMDDYKTAYPIKEKLKELYITSNYYNSNKNINLDNNGYGMIMDDLTKIDENKTNFSKRTNNSIDTASHGMPRHTFMYINKKLVNKKQKTFRQNIFNNLSPSRENKFYSSCNNSLGKINRTIRFFDANKENDDNIKMNNPMVKKSIESINYYGPYFSFCPSCKNKNMNYYYNMEPNKCIELIQFIKKVRNKNNIMNIKRTISVSPNQKTAIIQKEVLESENGTQNGINSKAGGDLSENEKIDNFE
jgi:hypothetical protein